jgi:hypothetical protein
MKQKPYKGKTLQGAVRRIGQLQNQVEECHALLNQWSYERMLMAKLAADSPQFSNPLDVVTAKRIRDGILTK